MSLTKEYWDTYLKEKMGNVLKFKDDGSFWLDCVGTDDDGNQKVQGKVRVGLDIYPKEM